MVRENLPRRVEEGKKKKTGEIQSTAVFTCGWCDRGSEAACKTSFNVVYICNTQLS